MTCIRDSVQENRYVAVCATERETERETETDRHTDRQTDTERQREDRGRETETKTQREKEFTFFGNTGTGLENVKFAQNKRHGTRNIKISYH